MMKSFSTSVPKAKRFLTVDFSQGMAEIVYVESHLGRLKLLAYDVQRIASDEQQNQKAEIDFITKFLEDHSITDHDVVLNISNVDSVIIKNLTLPVLPEEEIRGAIKWQLKEDIAFDLDAAAVDWQVTREFTDAEGVQKREYIFVIVKGETIGHYLSVAGQCQLNPIRITNGPFSFSHLLKHGSENPQRLAVLDIDYKESTLAIYTDNKLNFVRRLPISWEKITCSLTDILASEKGKIELSSEEAEELKNAFGIPLDEIQFAQDNIRATNILSLLRPLLEALVRELRFSFDYFASNFDAQRPVLLYVTGGGANLKNLDRYLGNELNLKVTYLSLPACVDYHVAGQEKLSQEKQNKIVNAISAAMADSSGINLLPREARTRQADLIQKTSLRMVTVTAAAILFLMLLIVEFQIFDYSNRLKTAQIHLQTIRPIQLLLEKIQSKEKLMEKIQQNRIPGDGLLRVIAHATPGEVILDEMQFEQPKHSLILEGTILATEEDAQTLLTDFLEHLNVSAYVAQAGLVSSQWTGEAEKFQIKCVLPGK